MNQVMERLGEFCSRAIRRLSVLLAAVSPPPALADSLHVAAAECSAASASSPSHSTSALASPCSLFSPSYLSSTTGAASSSQTPGSGRAGASSPRRRQREESPSLLSSLLARVQFFTQWSVAKQRSDFVHSLPRPWHPQVTNHTTPILLRLRSA